MPNNHPTLNDSDELLACPFCGNKAVWVLNKRTGCQLHGDPIQHVTLSCTIKHVQQNQQLPAEIVIAMGESGEYFKQGEKRAEIWLLKHGTPAPPFKVGRKVEANKTHEDGTPVILHHLIIRENRLFAPAIFPNILKKITMNG